MSSKHEFSNIPTKKLNLTVASITSTSTCHIRFYESNYWYLPISTISHSLLPSKHWLFHGAWEFDTWFHPKHWLVRFTSDMFDTFFEVIVWLMCYSHLRNITHMALYFDIINLDTLNTSISKSHSLRNVVHTKSISPLSAMKWQDGEHFCRNRRWVCFPGDFNTSMTWMFDFCVVSFIKKENEPCGLNVCDSLLQMNKIKIQSGMLHAITVRSRFLTNDWQQLSNICIRSEASP